MKKRQPAPVEIRNRFAAIYGEEKLAEKLAELTGANRATVFRWFESGFPDAIVLILEFLEKTPREYWPQRARNIGFLESHFATILIIKKRSSGPEATRLGHGPIKRIHKFCEQWLKLPKGSLPWHALI